MTDTTTTAAGGGVADLIARLERATGADRELDDEIDDMALERGWRTERAVVIYGSPPYTSSIDMALTLVPDRHCVLLVFNPRRSVCNVHTRPLGDPDGEWPAHAEAATPALALCIASLRARSATP